MVGSCGGATVMAFHILGTQLRLRLYPSMTPHCAAQNRHQQ